MKKNTELLRSSIMQEARSWVGTSFHHQGRVKGSALSEGGCDCLGLVMGIAQKLSLKSKFDEKPLISHDKRYYSKFPQKNNLVENLEKHLTVVNRTYIQTADIGLFSFSSIPQHIGIFDVNESIYLIHAYQDIGNVSEHYYDNYWQSKLVKIYNFNELC